jgi:hypothetical protein
VTPASAASGDDLSQQLAAVWEDVVGAEVAANARPVQLREGRLVVTTSSSAWAQTLQLMSDMVVARLNERLGGGSVGRAVFRHAGWEDFPRSAETPRQTAPARRDPKGDAGTRSGSGPGPARAEASTGDDMGGFSEDEKRALADVEELLLPASTKAAIRKAMMAGFVRSKQDFDR